MAWPEKVGQTEPMLGKVWGQMAARPLGCERRMSGT